MAKYTAKNISGDAGEYLVAYTVTHTLGWPCRLLGIDIGVDAEREVLDQSGDSNGDVIKIQVKSLGKMSVGDTHVYVDEDHIKYWKNFSAPIIVCCVDHSTATVFWQPIYQTEAYLSSGKGRRITFNAATSSKVNSASKPAFRDLVTPVAAKDFSADLATLKAYWAYWRRMSGITVHGNEHSYLDEVEAEAAKIEALVRKLRDGRRNFPWRFSPFDLQDIDAAESLTHTVRRFVHQASVESFY